MGLKLGPAKDRALRATHKAVYWRRSTAISILITVIAYACILGGVYCSKNADITNPGLFSMTLFVVGALLGFTSTSFEEQFTHLGDFQVFKNEETKRIMNFGFASGAISMLLTALIIWFIWSQPSVQGRLLLEGGLFLLIALNMMVRALRDQMCGALLATAVSEG